MGWKKFDGSRVHGNRAKGDKTVPPTRWWNHLYLKFFRWHKVTIYMVPDGIVCYRVGYKPEVGPAMLREELMTSRKFAVRNGHEDCVFYAVGSDGREIIILELEQCSDTFLPSDIPLI
ncbi:MAG: hypothetical protein WC551_01050 [Patescibacteria group bacterium]